MNNYFISFAPENAEFALWRPGQQAEPDIPVRCGAKDSPAPARPAHPLSLLPHNSPTAFSPDLLPASRSGKPVAPLPRHPADYTNAAVR